MNEALMFREERLRPHELCGIFVPTASPFINNRHGGAIEFDIVSHIRLITRLADERLNLDGLFLCSNAGQGREMPVNMIKESIYTGIQASRLVNKNLPVVVGALRKDVNEVTEVAKYAEENGADAIVLAPGFTEGDMEKNLKKVLEETNLPIIFYNNPQFQKGANIPLEFIEKAIKDKRIIGMKDTSSETGGMEYFEELLKRFQSKDFHVLQGNTKAGLDKSILKADGMVPVQANIFGRELVELLDKSHDYQPQILTLILDTFKIKKTEFNVNSTIGVIKRLLVEEGIFTSDIDYVKEG